MIIEYKINGKEIIEGVDWFLYERDDFRKLTLVFHELKKVIIENKNKDFSSIRSIVKIAYENKISKSNCCIWNNVNSVEITNWSKTLPELWIVKKQNNG